MVALYTAKLYDVTMTLFNEYMRGLEVLEFIAPTIGQFVRSMGVPVESSQVDRAAVIYAGDDDSVKFAMSEEYVSTLTDDELAAVLAHEAHHIILRHLQERFERVFDVDRYVIEAHECIINDQIPIRFGLPLPEDTFSGPREFNEDFADFTSAEGYEIVKNFYEAQNPDENADGQDKSDSSGAGAESSDEDSNGSDSGEPSNDDVSDSDDVDAAGGAASDDPDDTQANDPSQDTKGCNGIIIDPEADPETATQALDDLIARAFDGVSGDDIERELGSDARDAVQDSMDEANENSDGGFSMSDSPDGVYDSSHYASDGAVTNWEELIKHIDPGNGTDVARWNRFNPAITSIYPQVVLPLYERENYGNRAGKPVVVLALDFSGSTPSHLLSTLVSMADSIPSTRVEPKVITWSDSVCEYDQTKRTVERRGTNFRNMIRWVREEEARTDQEHHVVCVSDGLFTSVGTDYEDDRFHYVKIPTNYYNVSRYKHSFSNTYKLSDFVSSLGK